MKDKKIDRRSKEYKDAQKASKPSEGLGDDIEKIMVKTGIKTLVHALFGENCGCEERKKKLNSMFSYKKNVECLEEDEYNYLKDLFNRLGPVIHRRDQAQVLKIYNRVFNERQQPTSCGTCWIGIINKIKAVYQTYENEIGEI